MPKTTKTKSQKNVKPTEEFIPLPTPPYGEAEELKKDLEELAALNQILKSHLQYYIKKELIEIEEEKILDTIINDDTYSFDEYELDCISDGLLLLRIVHSKIDEQNNKKGE